LKNPRPDGFIAEFYTIINEEIISIFFKLFYKIGKKYHFISCMKD
jgi:hypothetical protein